MDERNEFSKAYTTLFNGITAALQDLEALTFRMKSLQYAAEEQYISAQPDDSPELSDEPVVENPDTGDASEAVGE